MTLSMAVRKSFGVAQFSGESPDAGTPRILRPSAEWDIPSEAIASLTLSIPARSMSILVAVLSLMLIIR